MKRFVLIILAVLLIVGCGVGEKVGVSPLPPADVEGNWSGIWIFEFGAKGSISLSLVQNGPKLDGTISIDGSLCYSNGSISGEVIGNDISMRVIVNDDLLIDLDGKFKEGEIEGSYEVVSSGDCRTEFGIWMVSKENPGN